MPLFQDFSNWRSAVSLIPTCSPRWGSASFSCVKTISILGVSYHGLRAPLRWALLGTLVGREQYHIMVLLFFPSLLHLSSKMTRVPAFIGILTLLEAKGFVFRLESQFSCGIARCCNHLVTWEQGSCSDGTCILPCVDLSACNSSELVWGQFLPAGKK